MWYILMIVGMYMCYPILRKIIEDKKVAEYFLKVSVVFTFLIPWLMQLVNDFAPKPIQSLFALLHGPIETMDLHLVIGYTFYFILGYYLSQKELTPKQYRHITWLGVCSFVITIVLSLVASYRAQQAVNYFSNFSLNVLFEAIFVFSWAKEHEGGDIKVKPITVKLSKYSFGVYLVHALVIGQLNERFALNTLSFNPIVSVPVIAGIVLAVSLAISMILNHIPVLNKYIV